MGKSRGDVPAGADRFSYFYWLKAAAGLAMALWLAGCGTISPPLGEPDAPVVAEVLGRPVQARTLDELTYWLLRTLTDRYAEDQGLTVTPAEVLAYREDQRRFMATQGVVQPVPGSEPPDERALRDDIARSFIRQHKIDAALYQQYGGRLAARSGGAEPVDAYRRFLMAQETLGRFRITDATLALAFWREQLTDGQRQFIAAGSADEIAAVRALTTNWPAGQPTR